MHDVHRYYRLLKLSEEKIKELKNCWLEEKQRRQKLEAQLAKYHEKIFKPSVKVDENDSHVSEDSNPQQEAKQKKKRGAKEGHTGTTRQKPQTIHEYIEVPLQKCPHCGGTDLKKLKDVLEHTQEDIVLVKPKATRFIKYLYYCPRCKTEVHGKGENEIPNAYIGPTARALATALRYEARVPYRQLETFFREAFELKLTPAALVGFDNKFSSQARPWYEFLKNHIKSTPYIHADETGWRVEGINHYLWIFNNARLALYHINPSRSSQIPIDMLGDNYAGILISDCYSGYNPVNARDKQKCLSHLLRDNHALSTTYPDDEQTQTFTDTFKKLMKNALQLQKDFRSKIINRSQLDKTTYTLKSNLKELISEPLNNSDTETFRQRISKHQREIFTFLIHTSIDATNNRAERGLRPNVIMRKVTFGNRSDSGRINHETIMSLLQTAKLNGTKPLTLLLNLANGCESEHLKKLLLDLESYPP